MNPPKTNVRSMSTHNQSKKIPSKRKLSSYVWNYFERIDNMIRCRVCKAKQSPRKDHSTTLLIRHLDIVHGLKERAANVSFPLTKPEKKWERTQPSPPLQLQRKNINLQEKIFASFERNDAGLWNCKQCDFVCPAINYFEMFHHLTTLHWNGIVPSFHENTPENDNRIVNKTAEAHTREDSNEDDPGDSSRDSTATDSKPVSKNIEDELQTFSKVNQRPGPMSSKKRGVSLAGRLPLDNNCTEKDRSKTNSDNDQGKDEIAVYKNHHDPCHKLQNLYPIVLLERCFSNVQKAVQNCEEKFKNETETSWASVSDNQSKFDHRHASLSSRKSMTASPRKTKFLKRPTAMQKWELIRKNMTVNIKSEVPADPPKLGVQVPSRYQTSCTAEYECDKDGQISVTYECIKTEKVGEKKNVAVITLNRPKALNALCRKLINEVNDAVTKFDNDDSVGAIIIAGSEKAFAAGTDIKEMQNYTYGEAIKQKYLFGWNGISEASKPLIAAVNGYALGGGCELALMCDIIYAGEEASFGQPEIIFGTIPEAGGIQRLTKAIGKSKAMEMVLTGNQISALEAKKSGLVSKVCPPEELLPEAIKLGENISTHSQLIVSMAKEAINSAYDTTLEEGLRLEEKIFCGTLATTDLKEGQAAFINKRLPKFRNQ